MEEKTTTPNTQNQSDSQTDIAQDNNSRIIFSGHHNTQSPVINQNTTIYTINDNSVTNTIAPIPYQIGPVGKLVNSIVEVVVKTAISTVVTALMSGDMENINIPELSGLNVSLVLFVLWFGVYGFASLLVLIFKLKQKRMRSTIITVFVIFLGLSYLQSELTKNGHQDYAKLIDIVLTVFVFSLIIVDVVIIIKRSIAVIKDKKNKKQQKAGKGV